jgi:hypothetical protein
MIIISVFYYQQLSGRNQQCKNGNVLAAIFTILRKAITSMVWHLEPPGKMSRLTGSVPSAVPKKTPSGRLTETGSDLPARTRRNAEQVLAVFFGGFY